MCIPVSEEQRYKPSGAQTGFVMQVFLKTADSSRQDS